MNILRRILMAALDPAYNANQVELQRLRGTMPMRRGWSRLVQAGVTVGFEHLCECGLDVKIVHPLDMFKKFRCTCGQTFSLLLDAGAVKATPDRIAEALMRLPVRQGAAAPQRPAPQVGTWNLDGDDTVQWCGTPQ